MTSSSRPQIDCPNPACTHPANDLGQKYCASCQNPLTYRYLWAVGSQAAQFPPASPIGDRYYVVSPQIWLDTTPGKPPTLPQEIPEAILPYLKLYRHSLHIPQVYGFCPVKEQDWQVLLLENVPVDPKTGQLYPTMIESFANAAPVRHVYWFWQILQLWTPLLELGLTTSLFQPKNIRVQGWRVWLLELYGDQSSVTKPDLQDLGYHWLTWTGKISLSDGQNFTGNYVDRLKEIGKLMRAPHAEVNGIRRQLNQLLLELAGQLPLRLRSAGATDSGPERSHNEDAYYPTRADLPKPGTKPNPNSLVSNLVMVCDGVGGHDGGEVASQLAVNSLKLALPTLLKEISAQPDISPPNLVSEEMAALIRVVNNTIASQNDAQGRAYRQRMGTTLVMGLQLGQKVPRADGSEFANSHELYVVNVGDSRAYWITENYCQQLTVDDDLTTREVCLGRGFYRQIKQRRDAGALIQALGTKDGNLIKPNIQRFIIEEDGLLMLCSDGLSDNGWVEKSWPEYATPILDERVSIEDGLKAWIDFANQKNGHDNTSIVVMRCRISPEKLVLFETNKLPNKTVVEGEMSDASKVLLYDTEAAEVNPASTVSQAQRNGSNLWLAIATFFLIVLVGCGIALVGFWQLNPEVFKDWQQKLFPSSQPEETPAENSDY
ncbi:MULTISPECIES: protein phosphatase 2C domain-containing protein [Planktothricoides]|uniref:Protein phosphatase 2C domain-containing protein n=2 Tax=Planktothricoides raciborskii TaxID=132608 RepID=A0AAU8JNB0_9CYAN|nr:MULTISPECIES: protein phosphatase 2C domain-containing protein [Planktothricoides]KOR37789.1 serine/threonine protein phosphatase [Planktothricoides sp. SR001]MBD2543546.1 protein phosphatase 2C domain-containing protein [Planktothricoides raciborskii FACHB-1370]MBD2581237.1 protein phosphatase 2C domain-containing protein [Planktothricoides raciborskii FACHB-1261]